MHVESGVICIYVCSEALLWLSGLLGLWDRLRLRVASQRTEYAEEWQLYPWIKITSQSKIKKLSNNPAQVPLNWRASSFPKPNKFHSVCLVVPREINHLYRTIATSCHRLNLAFSFTAAISFGFVSSFVLNLSFSVDSRSLVHQISDQLIILQTRKKTYRLVSSGLNESA